MKRRLAFACVCACLAACSSLPGAQQGTAPANPAGAQAPLGITANPPNLPVTSGNATEPAGWKTYISKELGISIGYPGDWILSKQPDGATFTSPKGQTIQLTLAQPALSSGAQCSRLITSYNVSTTACFDPKTNIYSAQFAPQSSAGSKQQLVLSTTGKDALAVYQQMLDSLRPLP
jgi:hypothetical protein